MNLVSQIKPISYLKTNAARIANELKNDGEAYIITQNGEAAMVVQSISEYEKTQESLAMLQLIAQGNKEIEEGKTAPAQAVFNLLRKRNNERL